MTDSQTTPEVPETPSRRSRVPIFAGALILIVALVVVIVATRGDDISTDLATKPTIEAPGGDPPTELETKDIVVGDGAEAKSGDTVDVQYVGVDYATGEEFDTSWTDDGKPGDPPFSFQLGEGQVIPGWDDGVEGMKVGGRRELTVPPDLAYGTAGQAPSIGPNATLVFVVDLVDVKPPSAAPASG